MDRTEKTADIIKSINSFRNKSISEPELTKKICDYFDFIKDKTLTISDFKFLKYLSSIIGIPHYYDLLVKDFQKNGKNIYDFDLNTLSSIIYESTLFVDNDIKLHKHQMSILNEFKPNQQNRVFLSASTSFGKTYLVYEIIKKMNYKNILLIFPTIALLSENLEKLTIDHKYHFFRDNYKFHTLSQEEKDVFDGNNIFIFTPERYLSFLDKYLSIIKFDFIFMDEIYKIDNEYTAKNTIEENERDTAYRIALYNALKDEKDMLLVGPYIEVTDSKEENQNLSFKYFLEYNKFIHLNYNNYQIVNKNISELSKKKFDNFEFEEENFIIYCRGPGSAEEIVRKRLEKQNTQPKNTEELKALIQHIGSNFHTDWIVVKALERGIGIHHGSIPKYIQKEIIKLFNCGTINILYCTTTITEGVNTSAKNIIIYSSFKGRKKINKFDAKNIEGRAGRFMHHYVGNVRVVDKKFNEIITSEDIGIKHRNYDKNSLKDEIDYFITDEKYLNQNEIEKKYKILSEIEKSQIPIEILNSYKTISYTSKIELFNSINNEFINKNKTIKNLISDINHNSIHWEEFDFVLKLLNPIIKNNNLKSLIKKYNKDENYYLTSLLHYYLKDGLQGLIEYALKKENSTINDSSKIDKIIRDKCQLVYQTLKYQLVKYLGIFNIMYKHVYSKKLDTQEHIPGLDKLLIKLEYNCFARDARIANDYGVPYKVLQYYDNLETSKKEALDIRKGFDEYEKRIFEDFQKILSIKK